MSEKEKRQIDKLVEKFEKLDEQGRSVFCAFGDGMLAAQTLMEKGKSEEQDKATA